MFYLALTFGLEEDPIGAVERMAGFVEQTAQDNGVSQPLWLTAGFTDGNAMYAVRYASDGHAPTLYHTCDTEHLYRLNKGLRGAVSQIRHANDRLRADRLHGGKVDRDPRKHGRHVRRRQNGLPCLLPPPRELNRPLANGCLFARAPASDCD